MRLTFGEHSLDTARFELRHHDQVVPLEPKVFDVLCYLARHRDRVVTKDELLEALWPGEHVVDAVVVRCIYVARRALGQRDVYGSPLSTVRGRGYRFVAPNTRESPSHAPPPLDVNPFVGREALMQRLSDTLSSVERGVGRVTLLSGAAGIGKTRACEELVESARQRAIDVWTTRCLAVEGTPPFRTLVQLVRVAMRSFGADNTTPALRAAYDRLVSLLPELRQGTASTSSVSTEHDHFRLFDAVGRLLRIACAQRPRIAFLDDLQWADMPTLHMLGFLAAEIADYPLLVLGTIREGELPSSDPHKLSLDRLGRYRQVERITLEPLQPIDVEHYVTSRLGKARPELARQLHQRSEGNAFFMVELLRPYVLQPDLLNSHVLPRLPDASRDIVRARFARLPADTRRALAAASLLGRAFDAQLVARIMDPAVDTPAHALQALHDAAQHQLITRDEDLGGRWNFVHGLVRESIYDDLAPNERAQLHLRLAHVLMTQVPEPLSEIAHHLRCALPCSEPYDAYVFARRAGDQAQQQHAHDTASQHYRHALLALQSAGARATPLDHIDIRMALAHSERRSGRASQAAELYEQAVAMARQQERPDLVAHAVLGVRDCQPLRAAPDARIQQLLFDALNALPDHEVHLRARLASRLAAVRSVVARRDMSARAAELARFVHDDTTLADVVSSRLHAAQRPAALHERLALANELEQLATRCGEPHWAREARIARYDAKLRLCDIAGALDALDACEQLAQTYRHPVMQMEVVRHRAQHALFEGRFDEALAGNLRTLELATQVESSLAEFHFGVQMIWLLRERGLLGQVDRGIDRYMDRYRWVETNAMAAVGHLYADKGELDQARRCLDFYADQNFDNVVDGEDWVAVCAHLASICHRLNASEHAPRLYDMLAPYADQNVVNGALISFGSAHHFLGLLASLDGDNDRAIRHFEAAATVNQRMGARPASTRSHVALATALRQRDANSARARDLQRRALEAARELGMHLPLNGAAS